MSAAPTRFFTLQSRLPRQMQLIPGTRLGAYEIVGLLGAGGMGEVYGAIDTRLDRQVAIKSLPEPLRADLERAGRFAREAKLLATLNHPNIATIHGLEEADGERFIVMELRETFAASGA